MVVKSVSWQRDETGKRPFTVYNLTVEGDHTYFAGTLDGGAWAHNLNCSDDTIHIVDENLPQIKVAAMLRAKGVNAFSEEELFGAGTKDPVIIKAMNGAVQNWKMITKNIRDFSPENRIPITGGNATKTAEQVMQQLGPILGF